MRKEKNTERTMSIDSIYGSTYLSAATVKSEGLKGKALVIYDVRVETFREDQDKVVLAFRDYPKELPLNKTNAKLLAEAFGDDEKLWKGRKIKLRNIMT